MRNDSDLENPLTPGPAPVNGRGEKRSIISVIPCAAQRGSGALQTRDLAPHARHANKIPDQRRGIARRIASGMTAYDRNPLPLAGEGGALAPGEGKSYFVKRAVILFGRIPSPPAPLP